MWFATFKKQSSPTQFLMCATCRLGAGPHSGLGGLLGGATPPHRIHPYFALCATDTIICAGERKRYFCLMSTALHSKCVPTWKWKSKYWAPVKFSRSNVKNYPFCVRKKMLYTCSYYIIAGVNLYLTIFQMYKNILHSQFVAKNVALYAFFSVNIWKIGNLDRVRIWQSSHMLVLSLGGFQ